MDVTKLIHDPQKVKDNLVSFEDSVVTKTGCKIYIPVRFTDANLAKVGIETHIIGFAAIVVDNAYYGVLSAMAMVPINPTETNRVKIGNFDYFEFVFKPGNTVILSRQLVKIDTITYYVFDEIFSKGKYPWYAGYEQLAQIYDSALKHSGVAVGENKEVTEMIVALVSRDPDDPTKYYRTAIRELNDLQVKRPFMIGLRSVTYAATNTTNKLAGSYFEVGVVGALVNPSERTENIEALLRA